MKVNNRFLYLTIKCILNWILVFIFEFYLFCSFHKVQSLTIHFNFLFRIRELTSHKIGTLLRISGQVVRTHPVHPELVSGTFICADCQTVIKDVEQQFKYTQVCCVGYFISIDRC